VLFWGGGGGGGDTVSGGSIDSFSGSTRGDGDYFDKFWNMNQIEQMCL
jgi:hypothetical protein